MYTERKVRLATLNTSGLCECGCGELTPLAKKDSIDRGYRRGENLRFVPGHHVKSGADNHKWKGGRWVHRTGYVYVYAPDHPAANTDGYVLEHRLVVEGVLGRRLATRERVHHRNGIKTDNTPNNLVVCESHSQHMREHHGDILRLKGHHGR
jgi:hypothetical protein